MNKWTKSYFEPSMGIYPLIRPFLLSELGKEHRSVDQEMPTVTLLITLYDSRPVLSRDTAETMVVSYVHTQRLMRARVIIGRYH